jgi:hypothetical protein
MTVARSQQPATGVWLLVLGNWFMVLIVESSALRPQFFFKAKLETRNA